MLRISFPRLFQLSACLMGGVFSLKAYLLTSSLLFANTPSSQAAQAGARPAGNAATAQTAAPAPAPDQKTPAPAAPPAGDENNTKKPCSSASPCVGQEKQTGLDLDPQAAAARKSLLADLASRTKELDEESRRIEEQKRTIEASQAALDVRLKQYDDRQSSLAEKTEQEKKQGDEEIERLVKIYEAMPPRDAASIFNVLDFRVLVPVMSKMNPRKASAILAAMSAERANMTTQMLAGVPRNAVAVQIKPRG